LKTLQDLWFTEKEALAKEEKKQITQTRTELIMSVISSVAHYEWLVELIDKLLQKDKEKKQKAFYGICSDICSSLIESLLLLEEQRAANPAVSTVFSWLILQQITPKLVNCIKALNVFCAACPSLLIPHVSTLHPYLKLDKLLVSTNYNFLIVF
jgi:hypothetical protein